MNWEQIIELHNAANVEIGNHSHSHEYLVDESYDLIKDDIEKSIKIFRKSWVTNQNIFLTLLVNTVLNSKKLLKNLDLNTRLANTGCY